MARKRFEFGQKVRHKALHYYRLKFIRYTDFGWYVWVVDLKEWRWFREDNGLKAGWK